MAPSRNLKEWGRKVVGIVFEAIHFIFTIAYRRPSAARGTSVSCMASLDGQTAR